MGKAKARNAAEAHTVRSSQAHRLPFRRMGGIVAQKSVVRPEYVHTFDGRYESPHRDSPSCDLFPDTI